VLLHLKYLDIERSAIYDTGRTAFGKAVTAMMWSDKAFGIYMGEAGTVTPFEGNVGDSDAIEGRASRPDRDGMDHCSDGDTRRSSWLTRAGASLTDTQVHSTARG
jgi:hypothetical protein